MKKIVDWINSHKIITICIALFLFVVQPIVVHWMFKTKAATSFWENTWGAGDLLGYIAGFEAFIGTVFLGVVAARQNDKANMINSKLLLLEKRRSIFERKPEVDLYDFRIQTLSRDELFNMNRTFYVHPDFSSRDIDDLHVVASVYYLVSFRIDNKSKFALQAGMQSLKMQDIRGGRIIEYSNIPFPYGTEFTEIPSMCVQSFCIVMDNQIIRDNSLISADLVVGILNYAGDRYKIITNFVVCLEACKDDTNTNATLHYSGSSLVPDEDLYL